MSDVIHIDPEKIAKTRTKLDLISLEQALKDFEVANARVVDLTRQLLESERKRAEVTNELEQMRLKGVVVQTPKDPTPSAPSSLKRVGVKVARKLVRTVSRRFKK